MLVSLDDPLLPAVVAAHAADEALSAIITVFKGLGGELKTALLVSNSSGRSRGQYTFQKRSLVLPRPHLYSPQSHTPHPADLATISRLPVSWTLRGGHNTGVGGLVLHLAKDGHSCRHLRAELRLLRPQQSGQACALCVRTTLVSVPN